MIVRALLPDPTLDGVFSRCASYINGFFYGLYASAFSAYLYTLAVYDVRSASRLCSYKADEDARERVFSERMIQHPATLTAVVVAGTAIRRLMN